MHGEATTAPGEPRPGTASVVLRRLAAIATVVALLVVAVILIFGGDGGHRYELVFQTGGQLVADNQVMIGGHPVGKVESLDLDDEARAIVEIEIDQELHEGSTAIIRATSLAGIANRYISISPGPNNEPALADGATIGPESTTSPVDVDQLFAAFGPRTRQGLGRFIRGQAAVYEGKGVAANESYKYLQPALSRTDAVLRELNSDQRLFRGFITSSARLFTALADRHDDLEQSVTNANTAFGTIARENVELDRSLRLLAPTFRQSNTTFVNLRAALDDLEQLVDTAKPATEDLAPFLARLRPVISEAVPVFTDLRKTVALPGPLERPRRALRDAAGGPGARRPGVRPRRAGDRRLPADARLRPSLHAGHPQRAHEAGSDHRLLRRQRPLRARRRRQPEHLLLPGRDR